MENVVMQPAPAADVAFWRGRRVFMTGHTGFKGGWLSLWLQALGAEVTGFALPAIDPSLFVLADAGRGMRSIFGDVRQPAVLASALVQSRAEVVIHMAAQSLVRPSYADPAATYETNVMGTVHLLDAIRQADGVRAVVVVTSDKCYANREWAWGYREDDALGGFDPYSNSKACAELVAQSFRSAYFPPSLHDRHGVAVATARAGNVIGGGDWSADRLIPDFVRAAESGVPMQVRHPGAMRPWQHVLEPLSGYLRLAQVLVETGAAACGAWNFGPADSEGHSVGEVLERLARVWSAPVELRSPDVLASVPHEAGLLALDSSKARRQLGWRARWSLDRTLHSIAQWHAAHAEGRDMRATTLAQINAFSHTSLAPKELQ